MGVIAVLSDISELTELRDAVKAMQRIQLLNNQLELRNQRLSETFGRFLSDEIVRQLLDTPDGLMLGGKKINAPENKKVRTVCDILYFATLVEE